MSVQRCQCEGIYTIEDLRAKGLESRLAGEELFLLVNLPYNVGAQTLFEFSSFSSNTMSQHDLFECCLAELLVSVQLGTAGAMDGARITQRVD